MCDRPDDAQTEPQQAIAAPTAPAFAIPPGYKPQAADTSAVADALGFWLLRQRTVQQRLAMGAVLNRNARLLSINCFKRRSPDLSYSALAQKLAKAWLQEHCPPNYLPEGNEMAWIQDSISLAAQRHSLLASLDIPYYVTGEVAAIAYGEPRTTQDLDVVLSVRAAAIGQLAAVLEQAGFYVSGAEDVVSGRMQTLQITHQESIARADLVVTGDSNFDRLQFERRQQYPLPDGTEVYFVSPEDLVLNKLRWGQRSNSEKQWRDVLAVPKTQADSLDSAYLRVWADQLSVSALLEQAWTEAGL